MLDSIEGRIENLLSQLENSALTAQEVELIEKKIAVLKQHQE